MSAFSDIGNGSGYIYVTGPGGTTEVIRSLRNDSQGRARVFAYGNVASTRTSATALYDTTFRWEGNRFWLDSDGAAVEGVINFPASAIEITAFVVGPRVYPNYTPASIAIAAGVATIDRAANFTLLQVDTEGMAASDTLDTITLNNVVSGDRIDIVGTSAARIVTVSSGTGNIYLNTATNFNTSTYQTRLSLQYTSGGGGLATGWYEIGRSPVFPSVTNQRTQSVAIPVQGIANLTLPDTGTTTLVPGTDKEYLYVTGSPVLVGAVAIATGGTPMDGDHFTVFYRATPTVGGFSVTIFGRLLTTTQTQQNLVVTTVYSSVSTTWRTIVAQDTFNLDFATTTQLATKEDSLGNPASDGQVLSSTAAGVRSWIPNGNFPVLHNDTSNNGTTAVVTEEFLKTYAMPENTMLTNGDILSISGVYQTAATANAKTITLYFGATAIGTVTGAFNNDTIIFEAEINRIDQNNQSTLCRIWVNDTAAPSTVVAQSTQYSLPAENLAGAVNVRMASTNGVAAANDTIARQFSVKLLKK